MITLPFKKMNNEKNLESFSKQKAVASKNKKLSLFNFEAVLSLLLIILLLWLSFSLTKSLMNTMSHQERIIKEKEEKNVLGLQVNDLKEEVEYYKSKGFLEESGRNKLGLIFPGEKVIILPEEQRQKLEKLVLEGNQKSTSETILPWKKWLHFFLE